VICTTCRQATFEYPSFILSYEACNYNGHGWAAGRGDALLQRARAPQDAPTAWRSTATRDRCSWIDIGMELYPEPRRGRLAARAGRGRRSGRPPVPPARPSSRPERMHMNEDEPTPLHCQVLRGQRARPQGPLPTSKVGCRATPSVQSATSLTGAPQGEVGPKAWSFRATRRPTRIGSGPIAALGPGEVFVGSAR